MVMKEEEAINKERNRIIREIDKLRPREITCFGTWGVLITQLKQIITQES